MILFGSASGRLVLMESKDKISQTDFELHNDGGSITSSCWKVTWYEDCVEAILSGEEQFDEQVILYVFANWRGTGCRIGKIRKRRRMYLFGSWRL